MRRIASVLGPVLLFGVFAIAACDKKADPPANEPVAVENAQLAQVQPGEAAPVAGEGTPTQAVEGEAAAGASAKGCPCKGGEGCSEADCGGEGKCACADKGCCEGKADCGGEGKADCGGAGKCDCAGKADCKCADKGCCEGKSACGGEGGDKAAHAGDHACCAGAKKTASADGAHEGCAGMKAAGAGGEHVGCGGCAGAKAAGAGGEHEGCAGKGHDHAQAVAPEPAVAAAHEGCGHAQAAAPVAPAVFDEASARHFGEAFALTAPRPLGEVIASSPDGLEEVVQVSGTIHEVCQTKGCWMVVRDGEREARVVMKGYSFFVPKDSKGKATLVEGTLQVKTVTEAQARHLAEDAGKDPSTVTGDRKEYVVTASGIAIGG